MYCNRCGLNPFRIRFFYTFRSIDFVVYLHLVPVPVSSSFIWIYIMVLSFMLLSIRTFKCLTNWISIFLNVKYSCFLPYIDFIDIHSTLSIQFSLWFILNMTKIYEKTASLLTHCFNEQALRCQSGYKVLYLNDVQLFKSFTRSI